MKYCPKCNQKYTDNTLDFCLEDGSRLISDSGKVSADTLFIPKPTIDPNIESPNVFNQNVPPTVQINDAKPTVQNKSEVIKQKVVHQSFRILEVLPIIIALAHNYWQWLYVSNQHSLDVMSFITSIPFLVWLILLIAGAGLSLIALKFCENKGFAYTSLVILAINFILFLVPKR